jgi:hypothetical protein
MTSTLTCGSQFAKRCASVYMNRPPSLSTLVYQLTVNIVLKVVDSKNLPEPVKMAFRMWDLVTKTSNSGKLGLG